MGKKEYLVWLILIIFVGLVPIWGSRFHVSTITDIMIVGLYSMSLNLLLGYTGLVTFGHAAYFGVGAYTTALLIRLAGVDYLITLIAAGILGGISALIIGFFCVRLTKVYFAMLTLAFTYHFNLPAFLLRVTRIHTVQVTGKYCRFVTPGTGTNFKENIFFIIGIRRQHQDL